MEPIVLQYIFREIEPYDKYGGLILWNEQVTQIFSSTFQKRDYTCIIQELNPKRKGHLVS